MTSREEMESFCVERARVVHRLDGTKRGGEKFVGWKGEAKFILLSGKLTEFYDRNDIKFLRK
jgi:hypothetical protein